MRHSGGGGGGGRFELNSNSATGVEILTDNAELIFRIHVTETEHNTHGKVGTTFQMSHTSAPCMNLR